MAITVGDLPTVPSSDLADMRRVTDGLLGVLRRHRVTAVGFVNEGKLEVRHAFEAFLAEHGYAVAPFSIENADYAYVGPQGPSWLYRFRVAKGLPLRLDLEPDPPAWVLEAFREVQAR